MIPWKIITTSITLAEMAKDIYTSIKKEKNNKSESDTGQSVQDLYIKVEAIAQNDVKQAELMAQLASEIKKNAYRSKFAATLAFIAFVITLVCLVYIIYI